MIRPPSIIWFERLYLACCAVGLVASILTIIRLPEIMAATLAQAESAPAPGNGDPETYHRGVEMGVTFMKYGVYGGLILGLILSAVIWFFIARKRSQVFKWIEVVLFAISTLGIVMVVLSILRGAATPGTDPLSHTLNFAAYGLQAAAVYFLFRPDSRDWFNGEPTDVSDVFR